MSSTSDPTLHPFHLETATSLENLTVSPTSSLSSLPSHPLHDVSANDNHTSARIASFPLGLGLVQDAAVKPSTTSWKDLDHGPPVLDQDQEDADAIDAGYTAGNALSQRTTFHITLIYLCRHSARPRSDHIGTTVPLRLTTALPRPAR